MRPSQFLSALICLTTVFFLFSPAHSELPTFPDRKSFRGIHGVSVAMLAYENMSEVALRPGHLVAHVEAKLRTAGIPVSDVKRSHTQDNTTSGPTDRQPGTTALLGIRLIRTEDSVLFGASKIGSVAVSVQLFQRVTIAHNQHSTFGITWSNHLSISGASKRPAKIVEALDKLVDLFLKDFRPDQSPGT